MVKNTFAELTAKVKYMTSEQTLTVNEITCPRMRCNLCFTALCAGSQSGHACV